VRNHGVTHFDPEGCFGCKVMTVSFAPSAMPSRGAGAHCATANTAEKQLSKDLDAYKRMRKAGLNPRATKGAARVESECGSEYEVLRGKSARDMCKETISWREGDIGTQKDVSQDGKQFRKRADEVLKATRAGEIV
jgi:hypothetical protein